MGSSSPVERSRESRYEQGTTFVLSCVVFGLVLILTAKELGWLGAEDVTDSPLAGHQVQDWQQYYRTAAYRLGDSSAAMTILVFNDYQCPGCRAFNNVVTSFQETHPVDVTVAYLRLPLSYHKAAEPALRAVGCMPTSAARAALHRELFRDQRNLGVRAWTSYALAAGVGDTAAFILCLRDTVKIAELESDRQFAREIGARGTPTIILNGWVLSRSPRIEELESALARLRRGRPPI